MAKIKYNDFIEQFILRPTLFAEYIIILSISLRCLLQHVNRDAVSLRYSRKLNFKT